MSVYFPYTKGVPHVAKADQNQRMALCRRLCVIELVRDLDRSNFVRSYPPVWNWACDVISTPMETAHCFSTIRPTPSSYSRSSSQPASHSSVRGIHVSCSNLSSRRGRLSTLEDFHRFVASLNSSEVKTLETVLKEQRGIEGQKEAESGGVFPSFTRISSISSYSACSMLAVSPVTLHALC